MYYNIITYCVYIYYNWLISFLYLQGIHVSFVLELSSNFIHAGFCLYKLGKSILTWPHYPLYYMKIKHENMWKLHVKQYCQNNCQKYSELSLQMNLVDIIFTLHFKQWILFISQLMNIILIQCSKWTTNKDLSYKENMMYTSCNFKSPLILS